MAPVVVDLISSSPPSGSPFAAQPPPATQQLQSCRVAVSGADAAGTVFPSSYSTFPSSDPGLSCMSRKVPLEAERSPKRRRLSPKGDSHGSIRGSSDLAGRSLESAPLGRVFERREDKPAGRANQDTISYISDPFTSSPLPSPAAIINGAAPPVIDLSSPQKPFPKRDEIAGSEIEDISGFPSSPASMGKRHHVDSRRATRSSPDPFVSSPQVRSTAAKPTLPTTGMALDSSNPFASSPPVKKVVEVSDGRPTQSHRRLRDFDPISSSAPQPSGGPSTVRARDNNSPAGSIVMIDDSDPELEKSSGDELPDIKNIQPVFPRRTARSPMRRALSDTHATNRHMASRKVTSPKVTADERARAREAKQKAQAADKEAKKAERDQQKRIRALEKEKAAALAEVNKIRTDKKVSTREMVVDLPVGLDEKLKTQVETILEGLDVQHTTWQSPMPNLVKLRRKVDSRFDDDEGHWIPCPSSIVDEDHVLVIVTAVELVKLAQDGLDAFVENIKSHLPTKKLLYILEGVTPWMRKNRNARNRQFASGVRTQNDTDAPPASSQPRRRNAAAPPAIISEDIIEDAMLQLQVVHGALVHHTNVPLETAQWIGNFTQHISTAPYRRQKERSTTTAGFCMESGQVRTGDDAADTYVRMLQEVARVTQPVAYGVAAEFGTVTTLVKGLEEGGQGRLEAVRKCANRDGAFSDRTLGKAISKRLWQVFLGRDETSTDI